MDEQSLRSLFVDSHLLSAVNHSLFLDDPIGNPLLFLFVALFATHLHLYAEDHLKSPKEIGDFIDAFLAGVTFPLDKFQFVNIATNKFPNISKILESFVSLKLFKPDANANGGFILLLL